jgi:23S rRNA pseudouridine1911/1915/1917 synthase
MALQGFVERNWTVMPGDTGSRLDVFLRARLPFLSRRELDDALRAGYFTTNGRPARKGDRLLQGDVVQFAGPASRLSDIPMGNARLAVPVLYEDASLIALNKPAGMDCHGFSARDHETLANFLVARWPELAGVGKSRWQPGLVHRIDRDTSGLVLAAKTQAAFDDLRGQFRRRTVKKIYLALVWGSTANEGTIALPLGHDPKDRRKMRGPSAPGRGAPRRKLWPALTRYRKLGEGMGVSLLQLEMETGVTHQLRAHMAAIAHAIVGDPLYAAAGRQSFGLRRHFLHASQLNFIHPVSGDAIALEAPLPAELAEVIKRLNVSRTRLS